MKKKAILSLVQNAVVLSPQVKDVPLAPTAESPKNSMPEKWVDKHALKFSFIMEL